MYSLRDMFDDDDVMIVMIIKMMMIMVMMMMMLIHFAIHYHHHRYYRYKHYITISWIVNSNEVITNISTFHHHYLQS